MHVSEKRRLKRRCCKNMYDAVKSTTKKEKMRKRNVVDFYTVTSKNKLDKIVYVKNIE